MKTKRGGIMKLNELYRNVYINALSVDYSNNYTSLLSDDNLIIPIHPPEYKQFVSTELRFGIYNCYISIPEDSKIEIYDLLFLFNKNDWYTHFDVNYAYELGLNVEFLSDYAYIYDENQCVYSKDVFGSFFDKVSKIRKQFPKNKIVKTLSSSLHGYISHVRKRYFHQDTMPDDIDENYFICDDLKNDDGTYTFECIDKNNIYFWNHARITVSFLLALARINISKTALEICKHNKVKNINKAIVRVQTDGITFNQQYITQIDLSKFNNLKMEDKLTGNLAFENVNKWV